MKSEPSKNNNPGSLSASEVGIVLKEGGKEQAAGAEKKVKDKRHYPGILDQGLVYSCAGPRVDPEEA